MKRILVSDNLGSAGIEMFQQAPEMEVDVKVGLQPEALKRIIGGYDAIAIRSATKITEDLLAAADRLKVVGRAGIGLDNVDIPAATKRGIIVMNTPDGNVVTTAEHAIALMLSLTRNIPQGTASLKEGRWEKKKLQGREVYNKVLGVIGFGKIGSIVADRARGLKMRVIVHDPFVNPEQIEKAGYEGVDLPELYRRADYITVHVPKLKSTIGLLDRDAFALMKDGVMIVNCARGGIVDEADLLAAMQSGKVAGAALDVFETEPPGMIPLFEQERLICTPHLGAATQEAQTNVAVAVASQIIDCLQNGTIVNAVNFPAVTGDILNRMRPYLTLADCIGSLQAQMARGAFQEVVIEYGGDFQGLDMSYVSRSVLKGLLTPVVKDDVNFINATVLANERGIKVTESTTSDSGDYSNLVTVHLTTADMVNTVAGSIFGKRDPRIVKINNFGLELIPEGHLALIHNLDRPGAIGSIGSTLGNHNINIGRMQVGQEDDGERNIIFLKTDTPISEACYADLIALPLVKSVTLLEF